MNIQILSYVLYQIKKYLEKPREEKIKKLILKRVLVE
jgi:hypothetical protein